MYCIVILKDVSVFCNKGSVIRTVVCNLYDMFYNLYYRFCNRDYKLYIYNECSIIRTVAMKTIENDRRLEECFRKYTFVEEVIYREITG